MTLRIGIIGAGTISQRHLNGYNKNPDVKVCAICDVNEETAKKRAAESGVERYCTDPAELLGDPNIDAVSILTPTFSHKDLVVAALEQGAFRASCMEAVASAYQKTLDLGK